MEPWAFLPAVHFLVVLYGSPMSTEDELTYVKSCFSSGFLVPGLQIVAAQVNKTLVDFDREESHFKGEASLAELHLLIRQVD